MCVDIVSFFFILLEVHRASYLSLISFSSFGKFLVIISLVTEFGSFSLSSSETSVLCTLEFLSSFLLCLSKF